MAWNSTAWNPADVAYASDLASSALVAAGATSDAASKADAKASDAASKATVAMSKASDASSAVAALRASTNFLVNQIFT